MRRGPGGQEPHLSRREMPNNNMSRKELTKTKEANLRRGDGTESGRGRAEADGKCSLRRRGARRSS